MCKWGVGFGDGIGTGTCAAGELGLGRGWQLAWQGTWACQGERRVGAWCGAEAWVTRVSGRLIGLSGARGRWVRVSVY